MATVTREATGFAVKLPDGVDGDEFDRRIRAAIQGVVESIGAQTEELHIDEAAVEALASTKVKSEVERSEQFADDNLDDEDKALFATILKYVNDHGPLAIIGLTARACRETEYATDPESDESNKLLAEALATTCDLAFEGGKKIFSAVKRYRKEAALASLLGSGSNSLPEQLKSAVNDLLEELKKRQFPGVK